MTDLPSIEHAVDALRRLTTGGGSEAPQHASSRILLTDMLGGQYQAWEELRDLIIEIARQYQDPEISRVFLLCLEGRQGSRQDVLEKNSLTYHPRTVNRYIEKVSRDVVARMTSSDYPESREARPISLDVSLYLDRKFYPPRLIEQSRVIAPRQGSMSFWSGAIQYEGRPRPKIEHLGHGSLFFRSEKAETIRIGVKFDPPVTQERSFRIRVTHDDERRSPEEVGWFGYLFSSAPERFSVEARFSERPSIVSWGLFEAKDDCPDEPVRLDEVTLTKVDGAWRAVSPTRRPPANIYQALIWHW